MSIIEKRKLPTPEPIIEFCKAIRAAGGQAYIVGGWVRDSVIGLDSKDIDIEVYKLPEEDLTRLLKTLGHKPDPVGASFGVYRIALVLHSVDVSLPRSDVKVAEGHKGFQVTLDPFATPYEATGRRDFTINSLMYDPLEEQIFDYFFGLDHIKSGVLTHMNYHFCEDPLRVLRGMQFCARFNLKASHALLEVCNSLVSAHSELPKERIFAEWLKWAKSRKPSAGLNFLRSSGWLVHYPELQALEKTEQNPRWHKEGSVWNHTLMTVDALVPILDEDGIQGDDRVVSMLAALCHDMGKPEATSFGTSKPGTPEHWRSPGHAKNISWAIRFLDRIGISPESNLELFQRIIPLCKEHMVHLDTIPSVSQARRLSIRLEPENIRNLLRVAKADRLGSISDESTPRFEEQLLVCAQQAEALDAAPKPILMGRHLLAMDPPVQPGPGMGKILKEAFQEQLDGNFANLDGALKWLSSKFASGLPKP